MRPIKILNGKILAFIATGMAMIVAIIMASLAWFSASGSPKVGAQSPIMLGADSDSLMVEVPNIDENYEGFMGETGTQYDGEDSPYTLEYSPIVIRYDDRESGETAPVDSRFFRYRILTDSSYVKQTRPTDPYEYYSEDEAKDNFCLVLVRLQKNVDEVSGDITYTEQETYWSENGFFREVHFEGSTAVKGSLLVMETGETYYKLKVIFQGDTAYHLLQETQEDIDEEYAFAFTDPKYMFAKFVLNIVFYVHGMNNLIEVPVGFTAETVAEETHLTYEAHYMTGVYGRNTILSITGFDFLDKNGNDRTLSLPEIYANYEQTQPAGEYYFVDWLEYEYDEDENLFIYYYRDVKENGTPDNVTTLNLRPIRDSSVYFYAVWDASPLVTIDDMTDSGEDPATYPLRPAGNHYAAAGYMQYNTTTKAITVYNPSSDGMVSMYSVPAPQRSGYEFMGWSTTQPEVDEEYSATGNINYAFTAGNLYKYYSAADSALYAVWIKYKTVRFHLDEVWGDANNPYATVVGVLTGVTAPKVNGVVTLSLLKTDSLAGYTATGTATIGANTRGLTLNHWATLAYELYTDASGIYLADVTDAGLDLYPVWNERNTYTVTLDLTMRSSAAAHAEGSITIDTAIVQGYYHTVLFGDGSNTASTGTFADTGTGGNVTVTVLEGTKFSDLGLSISITQTIAFGANKVKGWYLNANNDILITSWTLTNSSATQYDVDSYISGNIKLYVRYGS